ncbi:MAG TPA: DUF1326 domain-containing protein [Fimbriimonas sp.]|nr:DUF1326 domain-containing protein [Fimbriimonas sp.]
MMNLIAVMAIALAAPAGVTPKKMWHVKADYIEACSCNMFCECYFNTHPDGEELCEFNNAVMIRDGHVGDVKLNGAKFWLSGDLGSDFTKPLKKAILTYDTSLNQDQRDAVKYLVSQIYPLKFESFVEDTAPITWKRDGMNGYAKLGDKAEVTLTGVKGPSGKQTVINNLAYWGAKKNDGFELAYGTHHYKGNGMDYSYDKRNGFFITIESSGETE